MQIDRELASGASGSSSPAVDSLWAKSSPGGGLALLLHLFDVGAVAMEVLDRLPVQLLQRRAQVLGLEVVEFNQWCAALVACHDLGKATPGFQIKWDLGHQRAASAGFSFPLGAPGRHDAGSALLLKRHLIGRGLSRQDASLFASAVAAHHGFVIVSTLEAEQGRFPLDTCWVAAQTEIFQTVFETIGVDFLPLLTTDDASRAELHQWLAGLCATADWIGSSESLFTHDREFTGLGEWFANSRAVARAALDQCGLRGAISNPALDFEGALRISLPDKASPRPLQVTVLESVRDAPCGAPTLVVVEAPMGEGKTEAAFALDAWWRTKGLSRGLYMAMPTQATSNALFARVARYLGRVNAGNETELQLAHGAANASMTTLRLRDVGFGDEDASVVASAWLSGSKRVMLADNAVGTVDQALIAVLNAKHQFVRHFGLAGRTVIFDEVHAYDEYTGGLIERLISWLYSAGCNVVLMSATLPSSRVASLVKAFRGATPKIAPYPRVSITSAGLTETVSFAASRKFFVDVRSCSVDLNVIAEKAWCLAQKGAAVLVVLNKVARAQDTFRLLKAKTKRVALFHARFPMEQRLRTEEEVMNRFGPNGVDREGWILIATQVAEQSLDVDFDVLISDLAPVDLLMQRIGRIHRHKRQRPEGFDTPVVHVAGLADHAYSLPDMGPSSFVYERLPVLRTAWWLGSHRRLNLPEDIDMAVQWVYGSENPQDLQTSWVEPLAAARSDFEQAVQKQADLARRAALPEPANWFGASLAAPLDDEAASTGIARFGTRLGDPSVSCVPVYRLEGGYSVDGISVAWPFDKPLPKNVASALKQRYLRVSQRSLVNYLLAAELPAGWLRHSDLTGHRALVLDAMGQTEIDGLSVTMDSELGLVIKRNSMEH